MSEKTAKTVDAAVEIVTKVADGAPEAVQKTVEVVEHLATEVVKTPVKTKVLIGALALLAAGGIAAGTAYFIAQRRNKAEAKVLDEENSAVSKEDLDELAEADQLKIVPSSNSRRAKQ